MSCWIAFAVSAALLAAPLPPAATSVEAGPANVLTKEALLAKLSQLPGLEAKFREEKRMSLLVAPLVSQGTLHFVPPGRFARHTTDPSRQSVLIDGGRLEFGDARGQQSIDLKRNPAVRLFVESFVKILAGDGPALLKMYRLEFSAQPGSGWRLVLKPRLAPMNQLIDRITIEGDDIVLRRMEMVELGGDVTITTFSDVDAGRRYTKAELRRIFRLPQK